MNIKTKIVKEAEKDLRKLHNFEAEYRSGLVRLSALALTGLVAFGMTELGHGEDRRNINKAGESIVAQSVVFNLSDNNLTEKPAERNETVRMPVKFDDGLRAPAIAST